MHTLVQICHLSLRDYLHERLLSACAVLGLAAVLAPLLILFGVKFGVVETLTERLRNDPATLEISPVGSGHFSAADMDRWRDDGRVAFVMPRTRTLAATVELLPERGTPLHVSMEPTGHEDPLLARHALPVPALLLDSEDDPDHPGRLRTRAAASGVVLSAPVAERLGLRAGDQLTGRLERTRNGKVQAVRLPLKVIGVLPLAAQQKNVAYVPLPFLEARKITATGAPYPCLARNMPRTATSRLPNACMRASACTPAVWMTWRPCGTFSSSRASPSIPRPRPSIRSGAFPRPWTSSSCSSAAPLPRASRPPRPAAPWPPSGASSGSSACSVWEVFPRWSSCCSPCCRPCSRPCWARGWRWASTRLPRAWSTASLRPVSTIWSMSAACCRNMPSVTLVLVCLLSLLAALLPSLRGARTEPSEVIREYPQAALFAPLPPAAGGPAGSARRRRPGQTGR